MFEAFIDVDYSRMKHLLIEELEKEFSKRGFDKCVLGISGGLDSALVLSIAVDSLGKENVFTYYMPYTSSSKVNAEHAKAIAGMNNVQFEIIPISDIVNTYFNGRNIDKLRIGNFSARIRMAILFDKAKEHNSLVLGTSNRSEIIMGYATIFGDNAYSINPIGDIYKSQIFKLAKFFDIPEEIINKPPSADLWEGQTDEDEYQMTYREIDNISYLYFDRYKTIDEIIENGYEEEKIRKIIDRFNMNKYKRNTPYIIPISKLLKGE